MSERCFRFRLRSHHPAPDRATTDLRVSFEAGPDRWEPQEPSLTMPGFRLYLLSLLLCQHFYLVANARERLIPLQQVDGELLITTSGDWIMAAVEGEFRLQLDPEAEPAERARADAAAIAWIEERMKLCPVSRNLPQGVRKRIRLQLQA
jgi:hypothetical protein